MKSKKKFVLAGLMLLATVLVLPLVGCDTGSGGGTDGNGGNGGNGKVYTVSFDKGDNSEYTGDLPADITVESGTKLTAEQLKGLADTADYIFDGWYDGENKAEGGTYTVTKDVTLEAKWKPRDQVQISFKVSGNIVELSSEPAGAAIHYTTDGTDPKTSETRQEGNSVYITQQTTIKAYAEKLGELKPSDVVEKTYLVVTFYAKGGTFADGGREVASQIVESGKTIEEPPVTYPGTKNELYWKDESGAKVAFPLEVVEDMPLTAELGIKVSDTVYPKTSEVQVLSTEVYLSSLYVKDSEGNSVSKIFVKNRVDSIQPFVMGQYEVTQQLYEAVMGSNPSSFTSNVATGETQELRPVEQVSWYDAVVFCNKLSELMELEPVYSKGGQTDTSKWGAVPTSSDEGWKAITCDFTKSGYRLPTEAEWELAARGGDPEKGAWKSTYAGSSTIDGVAWYYANSSSKTHQVGTKAANTLGLYDMSGNVREWCWDWDGSITADTPSSGAASGSGKVYRGGCWDDNAGYWPVSYRYSTSSLNRISTIGFRLVRSAN